MVCTWSHRRSLQMKGKFILYSYRTKAGNLFKIGTHTSAVLPNAAPPPPPPIPHPKTTTFFVGFNPRVYVFMAFRGRRFVSKALHTGKTGKPMKAKPM